MYLKHIKGNIKYGVNSDLGPRTLILGGNGEGKSSIINAIELCLGGFASDVMGKSIVKSTADIINLKSNTDAKSNRTLDITGTFDNDMTCSYSVNRTSKGAGKATHTIDLPKPVRFPFQEVKEALGGSSENARNYLLDKLNISINMLTDEASEMLMSEINHQVSSNPSSGLAEHLQAVIELSKRRIRDAKTDIKACDITKDMIGQDYRPFDDGELEAAEKEMNDLLQAIMKKGRKISDSDVEAAKQSAILFATQLMEMRERLSNMPKVQFGAEEQNQIKILTAMHTLHSYHQENNDTTCILCKGLLPPEDPSLGGIEDALRTLSSWEQSVLDLKSLEKKIAEMEDMAAAAVDRYDNLVSQKEAVKSDGLETLYVDARRRYEDLKVNAEKARNLANLKLRLENSQSDLSKAEELKQEAEDTIVTVIDHAIDLFIEQVNKYLPMGFEFALDLSGNRCKYGMKVNSSTPSYALSGAEHNLCVLAIAAATASKDAFNVYIPEERAYDSRTLWSILDALKNVDGQVFLTTTILPDEPHSAWALVTVSQIPF